MVERAPVLVPAAAAYLAAMPVKFREQVARRIAGLGFDPHPPRSLKLHGTYGPLAEDGYRIRSGNYRIIYTIRDGVVIVLAIDDRKDVYKR